MYITKEGDKLDAMEELLTHGGQLYPARHPGSPTVLVRGKNITTYWPKDSAMRGKVILLAGEFGLEPQHQTYGRLCRWYVNHLLQIPYQNTYWHPQYLKLAKSAHHWHYQHIQTGDLGYCFEVDISSAYATSLLRGKSFLYDPYKGYMNDGDALDNFRNSLQLLPKPFRLQLLGELATHKRTFFRRLPDGKGNHIADMVTITKVNYGAAFNATHGAILRLYNDMTRLHEIGGNWIKRMHTDSLLVQADIPAATLEKVISCLVKSGYEYKIKAEGRAHFFDQNCGFVGKRVYGSPRILANHMKSQDVRYWSGRLESDLDLNWKQYRLPLDIPVEATP